ncbi:MAG: hypothetical protein ACLFSM_00100 [Thermoplasmata archaeon]
MKKKIFVFTIALSLLLSGTLVVVGGEVMDESVSKDFKEVESEATEIQDWHDLDEIRDDLSSDYVLVDELDEIQMVMRTTMLKEKIMK